MAKKIFGLDSMKLADIASDGGMGTNLKTLGETVAGSASMATEDNTTTDFNIEESSSPVESIVSQEGKITLAWSSYNISYNTLVRLFGGTGNPYRPLGAILTFGAITAGSLYTNGFYENVALTGGAGSGATADITVAGGAVTAVAIVNPGIGYAVGNSLTTAAANIGGTGSGFAVAVGTVQTGSAVAETWNAPDSFPDIEQSIQATDKKGNIVKIPRAKISAKLGLSFAKDKLGQLDFVATILQPTKAGEPRLKIISAN